MQPNRSIVVRPADARRYRCFRLLLRTVRQEAGLSQTELARRLGRAQSWVSKAESGERRIDAVELVDVLDAVGLSVAEFARRLRAEWSR